MMYLLGFLLFWAGIGTTDTIAQGPWTTWLIALGLLCVARGWYRTCSRVGRGGAVIPAEKQLLEQVLMVVIMIVLMVVVMPHLGGVFFP